MITLFEKLEQTRTSAADILSATDREACEAIFREYRKYTGELTRLYATLKDCLTAIRPTDDKDAYNRKPFYYPREKVAGRMEAIFEASADANTHFINQIENHFIHTYKLKFEGYNPDKKESAWRYRSEAKQPADHYSDYDFLIKNITAQAGTDFAATALSQIKADFLQNFYHDRDTPELKVSRISLPDYAHFCYYSDDFKLAYNDTQTYTLFRVLSHFETGGTTLSNKLNNLFSDLQKMIEQRKYPLGEKATSIRFYKNGKVELEFATSEAAKLFWQVYNLDSVIEKIKTKR